MKLKWKTLKFLDEIKDFYFLDLGLFFIDVVPYGEEWKVSLTTENDYLGDSKVFSDLESAKNGGVEMASNYLLSLLNTVKKSTKLIDMEWPWGDDDDPNHEEK